MANFTTEPKMRPRVEASAGIFDSSTCTAAERREHRVKGRIAVLAHDREQQEEEEPNDVLRSDEAGPAGQQAGGHSRYPVGIMPQ